MAEGCKPTAWRDFVYADPHLRELEDLREKGWQREAGDKCWEHRRKAAATPDQPKKKRRDLYWMTLQIGKEMARRTKIFKIDNDRPRVLDLCMAPGGFSATARRKLPESHIDAVTLPPELGGYEVMETDIFREIVYDDITMYISEMDVDFDLPDQHPDLVKFKRDRPFLNGRYDLIFCGGALAKGHKREEYRSNCERQRLTLAQLVFALNRLKTGGTFVLLLHRIESWETASMLYMISMFADVRTIKHPKHHGETSSFYLVAKNVDVERHSAIEALLYWKSLWTYFSFRDFRVMYPPSTALLGQDSERASSKLIDEFGERYLKMALPVWETQAKNLRDAPWMRCE